MEKLECRNVEKHVAQESEGSGKFVALIFTAVFNNAKCNACIEDIKSIEQNFSDSIKFYEYDCTNDYYRMDKYELISLPMIFVFDKNGIIKSFDHYDAATTTKILETILKQKK